MVQFVSKLLKLAGDVAPIGVLTINGRSVDLLLNSEPYEEEPEYEEDEDGNVQEGEWGEGTDYAIEFNWKTLLPSVSTSGFIYTVVELLGSRDIPPKKSDTLKALKRFKANPKSDFQDAWERAEVDFLEDLGEEDLIWWSGVNPNTITWTLR